MSEQNETPRRRDTGKRRSRSKFFESPLSTTLTCMLAFLAAALLIKSCVDFVKSIPKDPILSNSSSASTDTTGGTTDAPVYAVSSATISAQGDLLMHKPVIDTGLQTDGTYDFASIFRYLKSYSSGYDYAIANLETTFGGPDFPYRGNPSFNCPDTFADAIVDAGFDMLLTANNHCADTTATGVVRTLEQVRGKGLDTLGTQTSTQESKYAIAEVNDIRIGMICYTYATDETDDGRPSLNFNSYLAKAGLVNYFMEDKLERFYSEVKTSLSAMETEGVDATMFFIHWGTEYHTKESEIQNTIAQKLCDLGIDVIIGGHPHVVQPIELLQSTTDPAQKTVCIYSLGNAVSNQREGIDPAFEGGFTEDGVLFTVTFEKYSDGSVHLVETDVIPTWVNMHTTDGVKEYNILPLDIARESEWKQMFALTDSTFENAQDSYERTMEIVGEGLEECQTYLAQAKSDRQSVSPAA